MWFSDADATAIGRCLAQVAEDDGDIVDLFLESRDEFESRFEEPGPGVVERRDQGLAVRLVRKGHTFLSARDDPGSDALRSALRDVARVLPVNSYRVPELEPVRPIGVGDEEALRGFSRSVRQALRDRHCSFDFRMRLTSHRRRVQLVGKRLVPSAEREEFFSVYGSTPWGTFGTLLRERGEAGVGLVAEALLNRLRARDAAPISGFTGPVVMAPAATAVLLHEAVAHALEADTLILSGRPEAALGVTLGSKLLNVLDSPGQLPPGLRRETDDEGMPVLRRWLLQEGRVAQVLADRFHAGSSHHLLPGAARRSSRHLPPVPRSSHLELLPGELSFEQLLEGGEGLYFSEISRGRLNPLTGDLMLEFPYGRRFRSGSLGERVGRCVLRGKASDVLSVAEAVGEESVFAGAGWCAKGGHRLPVWATCPHLRFSRLEVAA